MSLIEKALEKTRQSERNKPQPNGARMPSTVVPPTPDRAEGAAAISARPIAAHRIQIDMQALRDAGILAPPESQHRHAAEVRAIKSRLLKPMRKEPRGPKRIVMVSSSLPGEGKTFNSVNLALSIAIEKDFHVLLVDGDVAKPNVSRLFRISDMPGLLDATHSATVDVDSLIVGTDLPSLDLLSAGTRSVDATESLTSDRMRSIIEHLAAVPNRIILIDSPPLLLTTEAAALAQHAGQVILVVRANATPQRAVLDSIALLGDRDGVSILLNDVAGTRLDNLYYGYGQEYAYGDPASAASTGPAGGSNNV